MNKDIFISLFTFKFNNERRNILEDIENIFDHFTLYKDDEKVDFSQFNSTNLKIIENMTNLGYPDEEICNIVGITLEQLYELDIFFDALRYAINLRNKYTSHVESQNNSYIDGYKDACLDASKKLMDTYDNLNKDKIN